MIAFVLGFAAKLWLPASNQTTAKIASGVLKIGSNFKREVLRQGVGALPNRNNWANWDPKIKRICIFMLQSPRVHIIY